MNIDLNNIVEQFNNKIFETIKDITAKHGDIVELLSLGDNYDNPDAVLLAADLHSSIYGYYMLLFHKANKRLDEIETSYKIWKSKKERQISELLFKKNQKNGMTAGQAKPTAKDIDNYFNEKIYNVERCKTYRKLIEHASENVSQLRIMRDTIESRKDMIKTISSLLIKSMDNGFVIPKHLNNKKIKKSKLIVDNEL